jgi:hypothetical protein
MQPAVIPQSMIVERRRLGLDHRDEMWEGVLHVNEPGNMDHQRTEARLVVVLHPLAEQLGLEAVPEAGVFDPDVAENRDFRTPDVLVVRPSTTSERGAEGAAELVIEIRSPGDESF